MLIAGYVIFLFTAGVESAAFLYVLTSYYVLYAMTTVAELYWERLRWRRELRELRSWDPAEREAFIESLWSSGARYEYRRRLDDLDGHEVDGQVERFHFPETERRATDRAFWLSVPVVGLAVVIALGALKPPVAWRWTFLITGFLGVVALLILVRRRRHMGTVLELSPFAVSEIRPNGHRRTLRFDQPLEARNRPRLRRLELRAPGGREFIAFDYDRAAGVRALRLMASYAGFHHDRSPDSGSVNVSRDG